MLVNVSWKTSEIFKISKEYFFPESLYLLGAGIGLPDWLVLDYSFLNCFYWLCNTVFFAWIVLVMFPMAQSIHMQATARSGHYIAYRQQHAQRGTGQDVQMHTEACFQSDWFPATLSLPPSDHTHILIVKKLAWAQGSESLQCGYLCYRELETKSS